MRKTLLDYTDQGSRHAFRHLQSRAGLGTVDFDYSPLPFARYVVEELDKVGYTAHPDVVLDHLEVERDGVMHALVFPPERPVPGTELVLVGGPAHGEVRRVSVDPLAPILAAGDRWEQAHLYEFAGLNVATGSWEWADGGLA